MQEMLARHKDVFTPAGLSFFQAAWDETVTKTYKDIIGKKGITFYSVYYILLLLL